MAFVPDASLQTGFPPDIFLPHFSNAAPFAVTPGSRLFCIHPIQMRCRATRTGLSVKTPPPPRKRTRLSLPFGKRACLFLATQP